METLFRPEVNDQANGQGITNTDTSAVAPSIDPLLIRLRASLQANFDQVKNYIDKNPLRPQPTDYFIKLTCSNRKVLQSAFKYYNQVTISAYQLQKRMEAAATLLQEGRLTHKQIASKCGYKNVNNFSRAFKKVFKQSPKSYLRSCYQQAKDLQDIKKDLPDINPDCNDMFSDVA